MQNNKKLKSAQEKKNDEFYTRFEDIEKEVLLYKDQLKDKIIYCNCDDPIRSNFVRFFILNFNNLHLKRLIATGFTINKKSLTKQEGMFDLIDNNSSYYLDIKNVSKDLENKFQKSKYDNLTNYEISGKNQRNIFKILYNNGDFRHEKCIKFLKETDIVITNPPFSIFREYFDYLIKYNKHISNNR